MFAFLTDIFCHIDDFCNSFDKNCQNYFLISNCAKRKKACRISLSEIMTIVVLFHRSEYKNFKYFYLYVIMGDLKKDFPNVLSYQRFVHIMEFALMPLVVFLAGLKGRETGLYYVDSTSIEVCHIKREKSHKVFKGLATKGKNSMGWFFGFSGLELNDSKTKIIYCKDKTRQEEYLEMSFDFLGYTFRPRLSYSKTKDEYFVGFSPAVSRMS